MTLVIKGSMREGFQWDILKVVVWFERNDEEKQYKNQVNCGFKRELDELDSLL